MHATRTYVRFECFFFFSLFKGTRHVRCCLKEYVVVVVVELVSFMEAAKQIELPLPLPLPLPQIELPLPSPSPSPLPPGYRFKPTDEELVHHYLMNKASSRAFQGQDFQDIDATDLYSKPPKSLGIIICFFYYYYFFILLGCCICS
jgi:hypothetical protein